MKPKTTTLALLVGGLLLTGLSAQISLTPIASIGQPDPVAAFDESAAEIVSHDPATQRLFVVNAQSDTIDVYSIADPLNPAFLFAIDVSDYGSPNSVDVNPDKKRHEIAVAVENGENKQADGYVLFFESTGDCEFISEAPAGALPDMVTYDHKGKKVLVANEGEPNDDYTDDPEGSVTIIDVKKSAANPVATQVSLGSLTPAQVAGVRITGPAGTSIAQDLEPEYIAVSPNNQKAYVACQENNAIIVIDIKTASIDRIFGLGFKDHSLPGNELDVSNRDGSINITNWPVRGLYMPDAIATYERDGEFFIVTANEGDSREYDTYIDEARVKDAGDPEEGVLPLDPVAFPDAATLQEDENLGRLKFVTTEGDIDGDGDYDELYSFGGRSFSIFKADGTLVYDSGNHFETITATLLPDDFNSNNDENGSFDSRSDDKGPEPEAVAICKIKGTIYAFIGLERIGGVMTYDITDPYNPVYVDYVNNRDFTQQFFEEDEEGEEFINGETLVAAGDLGPECVIYIDAKDSPTGEDLVVVSNEVSGTVTIYTVE